ncbi:LuxR C-terminal-related transcriptional regulator [Streptomyces sp. NPDC021020]|uniref:response regulator transcription factor n=1 Tax=Streptomyces sp. NPDC021020 TaxID=3365109 RepID=UPI0037A353BD
MAMSHLAAEAPAHPADAAALRCDFPVAGATRVLLGAGSPVMRTGLRTIFLAAGGIEVVAEVCQSRHVLRMAVDARPSVVVLEDGGLDGDTAELVRSVVGRTAGAAGAVVLTCCDETRVSALLRAGASALVHRDGKEYELLAAVRAVAAGHAYFSPPLARVALDLAAPHLPVPPEEGREPAAGEGALRELTPREREILDLVATGMSNAEVAAALHLSEKTVKFHVSNVLTKLRVRSRTQAVVYFRTLPAAAS